MEEWEKNVEILPEQKKTANGESNKTLQRKRNQCNVLALLKRALGYIWGRIRARLRGDLKTES